MSRILPDTVRRALERQDSGDFHPLLIELTHPLLLAPIRAANDVVPYRLNGRVYYGIPFEATLPSDGEATPTATLRMQNVDRRIGEAVRYITTPLRARVALYPNDAFAAPVATVVDGETLKLREQIGTPAPFYEAAFLKLRNITGNAASIEADIVGWDLTTEPWPRIRATKDRLPGLFR